MTPFAQRLRDAVQRAGVTQAWLAARYNAVSGAAIGSPTVSRWIAGDREPTLAAIEVLAKVLDVPPEWLAFGVSAGASQVGADDDDAAPLAPIDMFQTLDDMEAEAERSRRGPRGARKRAG